MKLDGATRVWIVSCSVAAVCIFLTGALRASSILGPGTLFGAFTISIAILLFFAIKLATARPRLNLTLAAETIVAIGIFSLIISIAVVLFSVSEFMIEISQRDLTITDMRHSLAVWRRLGGRSDSAVYRHLAATHRIQPCIRRQR